jgi:hypothetical protein
MTNALFNDNRLKLGVFGLNVSNGCAATTAEGHLQPTWQNNRDIAVMADRAGIEALVPVARWKGFGGKTNFNGTCFETYTWAAGPGRAFAQPWLGWVSPDRHPGADCRPAHAPHRHGAGWGGAELGQLRGRSRLLDQRCPARDGAGGPAPAVRPSPRPFVGTGAEGPCG